jgi:hypothetical protein
MHHGLIPMGLIEIVCAIIPMGELERGILFIYFLSGKNRNNPSQWEN